MEELKPFRSVSTDAEIAACLKVVRWKGVPRSCKLRAIKIHNSFKKLLQLTHTDWQKLSTRKVISKHLPDVCDISSDLDWLLGSGNNFFPISCSKYPKQLREIDDAPLGLFVKGDVNALYLPQIAMVGSRRFTPVGKKIAEELSKKLVTVGLCVTSGMALGIDACAHQGCCDGGGKTVAVAGCGLDIVYPWKNRLLAERIIQNGCIVSEFPIGTPPKKENFPARNRIISGLSLAVVVVEAAKRSGSLITARLAMEQGREVFAVPGSILSTQSQGCNWLIRQGAVLLRGVDDILFELQIPLGKFVDPGQVIKSDLHSDCEVLKVIAYEETTMDDVLNAVSLGIDDVSSRLVELELDGLIVRGHNGCYTRVC